MSEGRRREGAGGRPIKIEDGHTPADYCRGLDARVCVFVYVRVYSYLCEDQSEPTTDGVTAFRKVGTFWPVLTWWPPLNGLSGG